MSVPLGTILPWIGLPECVPSGYLLCDGASHPNAAFSDKLRALLAKLDARLQDGDDKFRTPDLRGKFLRMVGGNSRGLLQSQGHQFASHNHEFHSETNGGDPWRLMEGGGNGGGPGGVPVIQRYGAVANGPHYFHVQTRGGDETRPENVSVQFIIKVLESGEETC